MYVKGSISLKIKSIMASNILSGILYYWNIICHTNMRIQDNHCNIQKFKVLNNGTKGYCLMLCQTEVLFLLVW